MNLKKITAAAAVLSLAAASTASAADFKDISGHWAENMIIRLADADVVHGVSDTSFNPEGTVTRAEFLKMAMSAVKIEDVPFRSGECLDVTSSDWYGGCVQSALDKGLIPSDMIGSFASKLSEDGSGSGAVYSGYFGGDTPITREEMAYLAQSVYQYTLDESTAQNAATPVDMYFTDISSISHWAFDGVRHAYANGFVSGMEDDTFRPHDTATRAQAATIITKLLDKYE